VRFVVPVDPGRDEAAEWAARELARPEYQAAQPGLVARALNWLFERLADLIGRLPQGPGGALGVGILLTLVAAGVAYALWRVGAVRSQGRRRVAELFADDAPRTAQDHRDAADRAAAAGDWHTAAVERFRAVVRELEQRTVLAVQPGRTAAEAAQAAAAVLPALARDLNDGARVFDDVRYGDRAVGAEADATLRSLDQQVRQARVSIG